MRRGGSAAPARALRGTATRARAAPLALALAALGVALAGCETTAEKSARLERIDREHRRHVQQESLAAKVARPSTRVHVLSTALLKGSEATAAVVQVQNVSSATLRDIPIEVVVHGAGGSSVYTNGSPGQAPSLVSIPMLPPHGTLYWVDDQVQASGTPVSVSARIGEGAPVVGVAPAVSVSGSLGQEAGSPVVAGTVLNSSALEQHELVVYAVALRGGRVAAAGRAVIAQAAPGASTHFDAFLEGNPSGARLQLAAPPSTVE